jgi:peptidoglycan/xylan/chitin deacetylase (PgdA/CDA1 family)
MPRGAGRLCCALLLLLGCEKPRAAEPEPAAPEPAAPVREIAVTIDDLIVGGRDLGTVADRAMTEALLAHVVAAGVPAVGFVNEAKLCECDERAARIDILRLWTDAGLELGNHTYSHPSLTRTPLAEFEADVVRGEPVTRELLAQQGRALRYFRHPYLHTGPSAEVRAQFEAWLAERGYTVAPVTLDNSDWLFNWVYSNAKARGDRETMRRVGEAYVPYLGEVLSFFEEVEQRMFGRPIRHVLLLHANEINAEYFDDVAELLRGRGYKFVTLERALQDPAYQSQDGYVGGSGMSWMFRWDVARGKLVDWEREPDVPAFVRALYEAEPGP